MALGYEPKMGSLVLSRGQDFWYTSFLHKGGNFPVGTTAYIEIMDAAGAILATIPGDVQVNRIVFNAGHVDMNDIPHGSNYELFVVYSPDTVFKMEYGLVVRKEARFPLSDPVDVAPLAVSYTANFDSEFVGPKWKVLTSDGIEIHNRTIISERPSLGPTVIGGKNVACRWLWPMNGDSITVSVRLLNAGAGKFNILMCGDQYLDTYVGVQLETGLLNNNAYIITSGGGPTVPNYVSDDEPITVSNGNFFTARYVHATRNITLYKGENLSPLLSWTDEDEIVPHGLGYRYTGLSWQTSLLAPGCEPTDWEARDGV